MTVVMLDAILTFTIVACFTLIGLDDLRHYYHHAPDNARYALGVSHITFAVSLSFRLAAMVLAVPLLIGWIGRVLRTLAYLYLTYAFMLGSLHCHVPMFQALSCPSCSLDLLEPKRCKQATLRLLFFLASGSIVLCSSIWLAHYPQMHEKLYGWDVGYFWYSPANRLPLPIGLLHLVIQTGACACTTNLIIRAFPYTWTTVVLAISLVLNAVGYTIYIWLGFFNLQATRTIVTHAVMYNSLLLVYPLVQFAHTILYLVSITWVMLKQDHDLFMRQKRRHMRMISDRLATFTNMYQQSVQQAMRGEPRD